MTAVEMHSDGGYNRRYWLLAVVPEVPRFSASGGVFAAIMETVTQTAADLETVCNCRKTTIWFPRLGLGAVKNRR